MTQAAAPANAAHAAAGFRRSAGVSPTTTPIVGAAWTMTTVRTASGNVAAWADRL